MEKASSSQFKHLDLIVEFTSELQLIPWVDNFVADALSCIKIISIPIMGNYTEIAKNSKHWKKVTILNFSAPPFPHQTNKFGVIHYRTQHGFIYQNYSGARYSMLTTMCHIPASKRLSLKWDTNSYVAQIIKHSLYIPKTQLAITNLSLWGFKKSTLTSLAHLLYRKKKLLSAYHWQIHEMAKSITNRQRKINRYGIQSIATDSLNQNYSSNYQNESVSNENAHLPTTQLAIDGGTVISFAKGCHNDSPE